jgi:hypothetical protein
MTTINLILVNIANKVCRLHNSGLMLASGSEEASEASTNTIRVITDSTSRAITSSFISVTIKRISSGRALLLVASRSTVTSVTQASNMLHGIPRSVIHTSGLAGKMLLRPASSLVITVVRAHSTLASSSFVTSEALALARTAVTDTLIGTLSPRMQVVRVDRSTNPCKVKRASTRRAVRTSPFILAIKTLEALAVAVHFASSVTRALILAHTSLAMTLLSPHILTPRFLNKRRRTGRNSSGLSSGTGRHGSGCTRRLITGLASGLSSRGRDQSNISVVLSESRSFMRTIRAYGAVGSISKGLVVSIIRVKNVHNVVSSSHTSRSGKLNLTNTRHSNR